MPISKEEWDRLVKKGQQELKSRTQVTESSPSYTPNQNVVNKLRAAHYASETAGLSTPKQNRDTADLLFGGAFAPSYLADYAYEDLQNRNAQKFNKQMTKAESLFADKTNLSYDEAKDEVEYQKELEKNKKKADVYAAQGGENRDEYEAALNKESTDAYGKRKAVKAFSYEYSNQTRDEMDVEQKNLQSQYDAETDEYKKFAIEQQMKKAKKYSDSLLSSKEIQQKIDENQKIIDDYTKKYVAEGKKGVTQEEIDAYAKARDDLDYYKNLLNPAIVNEWDDDVYALEPDDMQAFSIVYQYEKQRESDEKAGVEDFNDPYRQSLDEQYRTAYNYLKQKYTEAEIKEMSKKFTYVADRDTAYQTSQDIINDIADKTGAERLPYVIGLGLGTALDAYNAPVKIIDGLVQSLTGEPINVYDSTYSIATINNAIQQGLVQQSAHQKAASMAVGVYCSLVQMGATMGAGIASGVEGLSLFLMGSSAASQTMKDMAEKGASNDKIIASSIATGVAEALFEKVSLEGWLHPENILASARVQASLGETVKALLVQWGCEISEEICTDIANEITDYIINGGNSNAAMTIEAYKNMGYSQKQAENMYLTDFGEQLGETALSSAIISMFMSPSSVISTDVQIDKAIRTAQAVANTTYGNAEESIKNYVLSGQSSEDADNIIQYAMEQTIADYAPKYEAIKQTVSETANEAMNAKYTVKGEERVRATNKYSEKDIDRIADFAAKRGVNVRFATFNKKGQLVDANGNVIFRNGANGFYTTENGQRTIYLNPRANANMALSFLAGHEISHDMQGTKEYDKLKEMVMDFYDRNVLRNGKVENELDAIRERAINTYYEEYKNMGMSDEQIATAIEEEIVADALGTMLQEGNLLRYVSNNIQSWQHGFPKLMQNLRDMFSDRSRADTIFGQYLKAYNASYSDNALGRNNAKMSMGSGIIGSEDTNGFTEDSRITAAVQEFRRLQEESRNLSEEELSLYRSGDQTIDDKLRKRLSTVLRGAVERSVNSNANQSKLLKLGSYKVHNNVDPQTFHDVFEIARQYLENGELVDLHDVETTEEHGVGYKECKNFLSDDGLSGFSITPDGDLISVFNLNLKGGFLRSIAKQVNKDAVTLDCYVSSKSMLSGAYRRAFGWKVAAIMDYNMMFDHDNIAVNHNMPPVAFMVKTDAKVVTKYFNKDQYDEAVAYRDSFKNVPEDKKASQYSSEHSKEYLNELASFSEEERVNDPRRQHPAPEAQKIIDDKARLLGAFEAVNGDIHFYHGTKAQFETFELKRAGQTYNGWSRWGRGVYVSSDTNYSKDYANNGYGYIMPLYVLSDNLFNAGEKPPAPLLTVLPDDLSDSWFETAEGSGMGFIETLEACHMDIRNTLEAFGYDGVFENTRRRTNVCVFDVEDVKSSLPYTFKDGEVVPLNLRLTNKESVIGENYTNTLFSKGNSVIIGNNSLNYDNLNIEGMRKLVEYANKHNVSWELRNVKGKQTIGRDVRGEFVPVSENTLKSIISKYNEDNDTIASDVYDFVSSSTDSEIDNAYNKALQDNKNIADNIINAEATKAGAITENGKAQHLYLGTTSFGYTVSNPQYAVTGTAIWTSTARDVAKGYAMTDTIQGAPSSRVRPISSAYVEDDGTIKTLLKNAKNILNIEYSDVNSETKKKLSSQLVEYIEKENNKIADAIQGGIVQNNTELYSSYPSGADGLYNDAMKLLDYTEALNPKFNDYYADFTKEQIRSFVADWNSEFKDAYGRLKSFFYNHQAEINNSDAQKFFSIIDGYELSDFLIDVESFVNELYSGDHVLSYESPMSPFGVFFVKESDVRDAIERFKNFGTYDLYGFAGDKPLVVDAEGASWLGIKFPQLGEDRTWSTDRIVKWAQDNGYTSVNIKNVYDNAYNGADGDDWIFFNSEQLKSADTATYDNNGKLIPPSERFNSEKKDWRWSKGESTIVYPPNLSSSDIARSEEFQEAYDNQDYRTAIRLVRERADQKGYIVGNFHHGRVSEFTVFDRSKGNRAGNWGNGFYFSNNDFDAEYNYGSEGSPDLNAKIDNLASNIVDFPEGYLTQEEWDTYGDDIDYDTAEKIARDRYITAEPSVIDAFLQIDNPAVLGGKDRTFLELYEDEDTGEIQGELLDFLDVLRDIRDEYDYFEFDDSIFDKIEEQAWDEGGIYLDDLEDIVRYGDPYAEVVDENGVTQEAWAGDILAHAFEAYGYDGIVDNRVSKKFPMMTGVDSGTTHYVVFKPEQIKDASPFTFDDNGELIPLYERFNDENPDIRWSKGNSVINSDLGITEEQRKAIRQFNIDHAEEFMQAAEAGDEETCSRILREKAKLLGAWSINGKEATDLYIGTDMFGYTVNDPKKTDWYAQFFATDDLDIARTYLKQGRNSAYRGRLDEVVPNFDSTKIGSLKRLMQYMTNYAEGDHGKYSLTDVYNADVYKKILDNARPIIDKIYATFADFEVDLYELESEDYSEYNKLSDAVDEIADGANRLDTFIHNLETFDPEFQSIRPLISAFSYSRNLLRHGIDLLYDAYDVETGEILDLMWDTAEELNDLSNELSQSYSSLWAVSDTFDNINDKSNKTSKLLVADTKSDGQTLYKTLNSVLNEYYNTTAKGIYNVFGYLGSNPLVLECNGCLWDNIPFAALGKGRRGNYTWKTRDIAKWAQNNGYTSVWFKDLVDTWDSSAGASNVFTFFNSEQIKSADPITYDDKGKIIPLENRLSLESNERIGKKFLDMRYQTGESSVSSNGDWEELRRRYGEEEPVQQTPQTPRNNAPTRRNNDTIRREVLPNIGNVNSLSRTRERVGGRPEPLIGTGERRQNIVNRIRDAGNFLATKFVDSAQLVRDASLRHGTNAYMAFTNAKGSAAMAGNALGWYTMENGRPVFTGNRIDMTGQVVGNSIAEVFYPYAHADESFLDAHNIEGRNLAERQKNHLDECQTYLVMKLNRDVIESTGRERISGYDLAESVKIIHDFESKYGMEYANALSRANREVTDYVADLNLQSGTLTQEDLDTMRQTYPNYVPTLREDGTDDFEDVDMSAGRQGVMGEQRRRATGGGRRLIPLLDAYESKINSAMRFGQRNIFFNNLLQTATQDAELARHINVLRTIPSSTNQTLAQILGQQNGRANTYVAFTNDGGAVVFEVDNVLNTAVKDITNPQLEVEQYLEGWQTINRMWRGAVTTKNPLFMVSNAFRDMGQAMLMSESVGQYWKDYGRAIREMRANSDLYKQFQASGVMSSSISEGLKKAQNNNFFTKLEGMGEIVEMLPRFSAYLTQIERYGNTYEGRLNAQFAAKDITTNFSQGGDWTRMLNRNGFNFLNANVQGLLQIGRKITDPLKNPSLNRNQRLQALGGFAIRLTALGFAPYAINAFLIGLNPDRKRDYDELSDSIKTQYLLFPFGDGNFIRIPYGRALVISTTLANLAQNAIEGKKIDVGESLKTIWDNVGVAKPSGLWTPVVDAHNNKTWYGGTLVNYTLAQREKEEQYDESTDEISKALGKLFNISPKKVNYVLDQWSGFIGDFVLPAFTHKYQSDNPLTYVTNPIVKRFTTDAVSNNDLYDTYNDMFTEVKKQAATDGSYYGAEQYFYSQSKEINSIWTQIHEVQRYKSLSQEEKDALQQKYMSYGSLDTYKVRQQIIRDMRKAINGIQRNTIENYDYIIDASSKYPITDDMTFSQKKTQTFKMNNDLFGSEYALQTYGGDTWDNAQLANTCGIDFESYAQYFANTVDLRADKDENGNTISGTLKKKKWEALSSMNLSEGQRAFLFAMEYKISQKTNYYDSKALQKALNDYINSLPLSDEEKKYLKDNLK